MANNQRLYRNFIVQNTDNELNGHETYTFNSNRLTKSIFRSRKGVKAR